MNKLIRISLFTKTLLLGSLIFGNVAFAQKFAEIKNWRYLPQNEDFWSDIIKSNGSPVTLAKSLDKIASDSKKFVISDLSGGERYLALADTMAQTGYPQIASLIYLKVIRQHPGTSLSQKGLVEISKLSENFEQDEAEMESLFNIGAFSDAPTDALPMLQFYIALNNSKKTLPSWVKPNTSAIPENSYWGIKKRYYKALSVYATKPEESIKILEELDLLASVYPPLKWRVDWQLARAYFDKKQYEKSEALFSKIQVPQRSAGVLQLDRAWNKYYSKDYSTALGLLESLKAPAFDIAAQPEQYLLAMLIYREVCHYPKVTQLLADFKAKFDDTYEKIKVGTPLEEIPFIVWMGLQSPPYRDQANIANNLIKEEQRLSKFFAENESNPFIGNLRKWIKVYKESLELKTTHEMSKTLRMKADTFLNVWDQVNLAEYISKLDEFRIRQVFEQREYKAETAKEVDYKLLFWPVKGEYWSDEFKNYRIILTDRCQGPKPVKRGSP